MSQRARVGKPSNADAWVGMIVTVVAVAALVEVFGHSSGSSSDRSNASASSSGGSDVTPSWDNWSASAPTPVAVDPPTRPSLYYPSNPTRSVNGDLTDPSIARR